MPNILTPISSLSCKYMPHGNSTADSINVCKLYLRLIQFTDIIYTIAAEITVPRKAF